LQHHRVKSVQDADLLSGKVRYAPLKSAWLFTMAGGALIGGTLTFTWPAVALFLVCTATVLLFGHSLGSHRKLIHNS
jgi:stearoyl-CoA desaturase (delta-9 desaturase)